MIELPPELKEIASRRMTSFHQAATDADITLDVTDSLKESWEAVFAFSDFVAQSCIRDPALLAGLIAQDELTPKKAVDQLQESLQARLEGVNDIPMLGERLRQFRRAQMVRIAWRDLAGWADLNETMQDLSDLADVCIGCARDFIHQQMSSLYGVPVNRQGEEQHLVLLGMGKLGARELNFSSDIDLIFAYPSVGSTQGGSKSITNEEFFVRLARQFIKVIGGATVSGIVFRVDMDLRPYGENGPLVMSFDAMVNYYQRQGREWERYAWIKARAIADHQGGGKRLLESLRPFVYRRYLDFSVFESLRKMKRKIALEVARREMADHIKLGPGGIREIEFFAQIFQLLRGGVTPTLQQRRIQKIIPLLSQEGLINPSTGRDMLEAYTFLRMTENRLQAYKDQQCHDLPKDGLERARLAVSLGFDDYEAYYSRLQVHRQKVEHQFQMLLEIDEPEAAGEDDQIDDLMERVWHQLKDADQYQTALRETGFVNPPDVIQQLASLKKSRATQSLSPQGREWLDKLMPRVMGAACQADQPDQTLFRILDLLKAIEQRISYLALLLENPTVLTHLIKLANASSWIISFLSRHPVLLDELLDPRMLYAPPQKAEMRQELRKKLDAVETGDLEYQIEALCIFKQIQVLRVAAADVTGALKLMRTSDHLTHIAEVVLEAVLDIAWDHLVDKHGKPRCVWDGTVCEPGFAVLAYGKFGGFELGYGSDLDLVFLHAGTSGDTQGGAKPLDNAQFFARLGQRVVHILTAYTRAGRLYETDMRLRPSGSSGLLVCHINAFHEYQKHQARTWEHQALIRARPVCGDAQMAQGFERIRKAVLALPRDEPTLRKEVSDMRRRLREAQMNRQPGCFDLKQGVGGIVDIEFLVQYLVLANAHRRPRLTDWTDVVRLLERLIEARIVDADAAKLLKKAYLTWRENVHRLNLQEKEGCIPEADAAELRRQVAPLWKSYFE